MTRFTKIVRTRDGRSAFENGELALDRRIVAEGVPAMAIGELGSSGGVQFLSSAAFDSAPHPAPREQWVVMLRGTIEVTVGDGDRRRFGPGDLVLATDTTGTGHVTTGVGDAPFEALFIPV
ncbi:MULTISPECIES: cupin domain-containing protein [unclassified Actinomadura]|uniref:cupin domain-containing protein n=1 Tax=unclassified Actinomadura TaxID=2626254 RepID=UPI0011ED930D|nr:cupin domain-containing protein [Actinomadura sp. K4S16]